MDASFEGNEENRSASRTGDAEQSGRLEAAAQAGTGADGEAVGAAPTNRPPISSQSQVSLKGFPEYKTTFGIDWLEYGGVLGWKDEEPFERIMDQLENAKLQCQALDQDEVRIRLNDSEAVYVQRMGLKRGQGGGTYFDYRFTYQGIPICLAKRRSVVGESANVFVQLRGNECLLHGAVEAHRKVADLLARLGAGEVQDEKISRIDLRLDVVGLPITMFKDLIERRCFVTRSRRVHEWHNKATGIWTGFTVGKHPRELRVYDKKYQQLRKYDAEVYQALKDRCWGGIDPDYAVRIEAQLGRNYLKRFEIDSLADVQAHLASLLNQLTTEFFRFAAEPIVSADKHQSRAEVHPLWAGVQAALLEHAQVPAQKLVPIQYESVDPRKLIAQGIGCLLSALLQQNKVFTTITELGQLIVNMINEHFHDEALQLRLIKRYWQRFKDKAYDFNSAA